MSGSKGLRNSFCCWQLSCLKRFCVVENLPGYISTPLETNGIVATVVTNIPATIRNSQEACYKNGLG